MESTAGPASRPPTMEDVAARAGVSRALVSIVFRDLPGASDATRLRVREAAHSIGYSPDQRARLLGRKRSQLLGVTFGVEHPFHADSSRRFMPPRKRTASTLRSVPSPRRAAKTGPSPHCSPTAAKRLCCWGRA